MNRWLDRRNTVIFTCMTEESEREPGPSRRTGAARSLREGKAATILEICPAAKPTPHLVLDY